MSESDRYIVFVDDDADDREIIGECCKELGVAANAYFLSSGEKLFSFLSQKQAGDFPSLIVLDFNMPVMNGAQVILRLKRDSRYQGIPVILFSTAIRSLEEVVSMGAEAFYQKPSDYPGIRKIVSSFFQRL